MTVPAKILVVDDDPTARLLMCVALEKTGFIVRLAVDGADALRQFFHDSFDLVMLDVKMPDMSGVDVCAALRARGGEHLPIVMVTGMDDAMSVKATYDAGATDFIAKPINWAMIGHRAHYLVRASHALVNLSKANARGKQDQEEILRLNRGLEERVRQRTAELLRTENALRQSQKLEALGQLTGGVAHDFNNMLAVISSSVELLKSNKLPEERRGHYLDRIFDTVGRAAKLTSQLLAFARQQPLSPDIFNVAQQVQGVVDLVRPLMGSQVQIHYEHCGDKACFAEVDINQFETALVNLAVNARDAMNANGQLTFKVQAVDNVPAGPGHGRRLGKFVAISVSDTGCGIAADKLEAIFEPFYTTKEVGKGTGLGLSQVFGFVKQSGGEIVVRSEPGSGAAFTLYLTQAEGVPTPHTEAAPQEQGQDTFSRVLVVEDNETLAQTTSEVLRVLGYQPVWAANAAAALEQLARHDEHFDLVFSDVIMPGMNGIEFGQLVRQRYPGLPVVLTSGYSAVIAENGRHGFELVLKPYTVNTLLKAFRKATAVQT